MSLDKGRVQVHRFAAHALDEMKEQVASFKADKSWRDFRKQVALAGEEDLPVPAALKAELRPYQVEGFRWMARLHAWGAGACLADDMGLGKTLQAMALLLHLAEKGPSLVVCPASILRRTKNKVLDELPAKTEITLSVELSGEEMAFYEALRRQAVETIASGEGNNGQQHLQALAEITRLRLACCHASLVQEGLDLPSSKLDAVMDIVDELLVNQHQALIFSQFVGHLALVRRVLDERGVGYQYLDGSTPVPEREKAVRDFQAGKSPLFLISLKAGGLGLNLTAADYVLHLDPWWNPAIEDQASDRAHRMGQRRPVTIYRMVAKNTIEEKIVQLHATKRDMADAMLEGTDQSARLSTADLLALLREV